MPDIKQRIEWIDVLKGIAIIFVVLGHNPYMAELPQKAHSVIFSFHIPLFFFISGYLFNPDLTSGAFLRRRFNSILKPYLFTVTLISIVYILFKSSPSWGWYIFWMLYGSGPNLPKAALHLWFLPCLFLTAVFAWCLLKYIKVLKKSLFIQLLLISVLLIFGVFIIHLFWNVKIPQLTADAQQFLINGLLDNPAYSKAQLLSEDQFVLKGLPWCLDIVLISAAFFISGYVVKQNRLEYLFNKGTIAFIMLLVFIALHYFYNYTIDLHERRYDNLFACAVLAYAGIYLCMYLANVIASWESLPTKAIQYIGKYTLIIFIFHPIMQSTLYRILMSILPPSIYLVAILPAFAAGVLLPLLLNYLVLERFKFFRYWYYAR